MALDQNLALEGIFLHRVAADIEQVRVAAQDIAIPKQHDTAAFAGAAVLKDDMDRIQPILHGLLTPDPTKPVCYAKVLRPPSTQQVCSGVFLVPLKQFDRNALGPANEADPHARPDGVGLRGEFHALGLDLGGDRIEALDRQSEVVAPLLGMTWGRTDTVAGCNRCNE